MSYLVCSGRPNAGKSSIISGALGLNAPSGKRPGTTRRITQIPLSKGLHVVDMPGYGRVSRGSRALEDALKDQILDFLEDNTSNIVLAVHVLDISNFLEVTLRLEEKGFRSLDVEMVELLSTSMDEFPLVVANKIDRTNTVELDSALIELRGRLRECCPIMDEGSIIPVSARTGKGMGYLKSTVHDCLVSKGFTAPFRRV
jgi:GTP-binding protein EngB required for normal cell division